MRCTQNVHKGLKIDISICEKKFTDLLHFKSLKTIIKRCFNVVSYIIIELWQNLMLPGRNEHEMRLQIPITVLTKNSVMQILCTSRSTTSPTQTL